jgi:hypothetical protein
MVPASYSTLISSNPLSKVNNILPPLLRRRRERM